MVHCKLVKQKTHSFEWVSWYLQSRCFGRTGTHGFILILIKYLLGFLDFELFFQ